jgi:hypothetical protein
VTLDTNIVTFEVAANGSAITLDAGGNLEVNGVSTTGQVGAVKQLQVTSDGNTIIALSSAGCLYTAPVSTPLR